MAGVELSVQPVIYINTGDGNPTVKDIRLFLEAVTKLGIPDDYEIMDCVLAIELDGTAVELIECGEHMAGESVHDILVTTHKCVPTKKENNE